MKTENRGRPRKITKDDKKEFGEFVRNMREQLGWTQEKLAAWMGTRVSAIRNYEDGFTIPNYRNDFETLLRDTVKEEMRRRRESA